MKRIISFSCLMATIFMTACTGNTVTSPTLDEVVKFY